MNQRVTLLVLGILMLSYSPPMGHGYEIQAEGSEELPTGFERVEISPDPNSIRDLGEPTVHEGLEDVRQVIADSVIGIYTESGLIPRLSMDSGIAIPRSDLVMALVDGEVGLWEARVELSEIEGIEIRSTIPPSGFLIQGTGESLEALSTANSVVAIHYVPAGLLVHESLMQFTAGDEVQVEVIGWKNEQLIRQDDPGLGLKDTLSSAASRWLDDGWSPEAGRYWGTLALDSLPSLLAHPSVAYVAPQPVLVIHNDQARSNMGINTVDNAFISELNGSGQIVAVGDSGLDGDHGDFTGRISGLTSVTPGDSSTADPSSGHGTHVACTVLGSGFRSNGGYQGIAPEADLYFQAMEDDDSGALYSYGINSMLNSAYNAGARIHTNSWGAGSGSGSYSTQSEDADDRTSTWDQYWTYDGMTVLFAAGNERDDGVSPPGTAKNVITIGGHKNRYSGAPDEMYYWSSRGPTDDGRIKPDLVAPGDYVRSCKAQEASDAEGSWDNTWYLEYSGTSMATPAAAGASALVREYLTEVIGRQAPQGALVKGLLILGAKDMGTRDIPNEDEGWGRLNLVDSLIADGEVAIFVDDRSRIRSGQTVEYNFDVTSSGHEFKAVLTWSDYPGSTSSTTQLRNDLDLELVSPTGQSFKGNVFTNGRSVTGGTKDSVNNVEVIALDSAAQGTWTLRVRDSQHGGSRTWQPFSLAVRGFNVNDLNPDPTFVAGSFDVSTPIPQVGEQVEISVSVKNLGAGTVSDLQVLSRVDSALLGEELVSLSPGETKEVSWEWTPSEEGEASFEFFIDPNNLIEELSESNNYIGEIVIVSAPGVRVTADSELITLSDPTSTTTTWDLTLTNTALFETNASISASSPVRMQDGTEFGWFQSFTSNTFNLMPTESVSVGMTMVHPSPPPPGTYSMTISGYDIENDIESELALIFDVPVLGDAEIQILNEQILVSPLLPTNTQISVINGGNGAQSYDVELVSPAGWHLGLDDIGAFEGSSHGSTGTLQKDSNKIVDITINPPGAMIPAGSTYEAAIIVHSRVSSDSWTQDIVLVVDSVDEVSATPISGGIENQVAPDALLEIPISFNNMGNRDLELQPYLMTIPGGWAVSGSLSTITVPAGQTEAWTMSIQGNGVAVSGLLELRFATEDGFKIDWNRTLDVLSAASPRISFHQIDLPDGTSSDTILGVPAHPVGSPGFDLTWMVWNEGSGTWRPSTYLEVPNDEWSSTCTGPTSLSPGQSSTVSCLVTIPISEQAGSEPAITLVMSGEGIEIRDTQSLLVESAPRIIWVLNSEPLAHEGYSATFRLDVTNTGNTDISHTLQIDAPSQWNAHVVDGVRIILAPGESRSVIVDFTPNNGNDGSLTLTMVEAEDMEGGVFEISVDVKPSVGGQDGLESILPILILAVLAALAIGIGTFVYVRTDGNPSSILSNEKVSKAVQKIVPKVEEKATSGIPCWLCSIDVTVGEAWACSSCGARYHKAGQVSGCDIMNSGRCMHCDAESEHLVEA
ncbi:MAG: hypothetical protein CMB46_03630 [Euryarchaeota archaeon]|nr:hypothetical protein [Euryarchaeota archaeon]